MPIVRWLGKKITGVLGRLVKLTVGLAVVSGLVLLLDILLLQQSERPDDD